MIHSLLLLEIFVIYERQKAPVRIGTSALVVPPKFDPPLNGRILRRSVTGTPGDPYFVVRTIPGNGSESRLQGGNDKRLSEGAFSRRPLSLSGMRLLSCPWWQPFVSLGENAKSARPHRDERARGSTQIRPAP